MSDLERIVSKIYLDLQDVKAEISQLRSQSEAKSKTSEGWMSTRKAAAALQDQGVESIKHLTNLRLGGAFSEAKGEIRNVSRGKNRPTWHYNVPKCRKALQRYFSSLSD